MTQIDGSPSILSEREQGGGRRLREMVRQFTPNWFAATMGTGAPALALNQFPLPLAVYALATLALANAAHVAFLSVIGAVLVVFLATFWLIVAARTVAGAWRGTLFIAPCLLATGDHAFGLRNR